MKRMSILHSQLKKFRHAFEQNVVYKLKILDRKYHRPTEKEAILDLNSIEENSSNHVFLLLVAVDYNYDN